MATGRVLCFLALSLVIAGLDIFTKNLALASLHPYTAWPVLPMLNITLAFNTGAAFSFLSGAGDWHKWFFLGFTLLMLCVLLTWLVKSKAQPSLQAFGLSLLLGGAFGNFIDRLRFGYVVDFIDVYYQNYHWPIFNLADTAICIGALCLAVSLSRDTNRKLA